MTLRCRTGRALARFMDQPRGEPMHEEPYRVLNAIRHGAVGELAGHERWIAALKTIQWVAESDRGSLVLTSEGQQAFGRMAADRHRSSGSQGRSHAYGALAPSANTPDGGASKPH